MSRYLRLFKHFVAFSMMRNLEFRFDFTLRIIMDVVFYLANIFFYKVLFLHTDTLGGWTESQVMIFLSGYLVVDAIQMCFVSNGIWMLPFLINRGELDYYLLRPVSSLFFVTFRDFSVSSFINLMIAISFLVYTFVTSNMSFSFSAICFYLFLLLNGFVIFYSLRVLSMIPVFWTHQGRGFEMLFWTLENGMKKPDRIFKGIALKFFTFVIPFFLVCSFPAKVLFGENPILTSVYCLAGSSIFFFILVTLWSLGLRSYSSASS